LSNLGRLKQLGYNLLRKQKELRTWQEKGNIKTNSYDKQRLQETNHKKFPLEGKEEIGKVQEKISNDNTPV